MQAPTEIKQILSDAIDLTDDVIAVFDANDKVVFFNQAFCQLFEVSEQNADSFTFEYLIRNSFNNNVGVKVETDDINDWLDNANQKRRSVPFRSFEVDTCNNKWFLFTERTVGKHLFMYGTDITARKELEMELVQTQNKLQQLASTDYLTGIYNRREFNKLASQELLRCERNNLNATLIIFDIDYFKQINDRYGHACGDAVLVGLADRIKGELRSYDIFARIGGEEFAVLLPEVDADEAMDIAKRYLNKVADVPFYYDSDNISITISIGLSDSYPKVRTLDQALKSADDNLYVAKEKGRNQIEAPTH